MTRPSQQFNLEEVVPSRAKTWVGLVGTLLTFSGPFILDSADILPPPWPVIIGVFFALATTLGIYKAEYKPPGSILVPDTPEVVKAAINETHPVDPPVGSTKETYEAPVQPTAPRRTEVSRSEPTTRKWNHPWKG